MEATSFTEENAILDPPKGMTHQECQSLSVHRGVDPTGKQVVVSCWKPTREELEEINKTGRVWLIIWGQTMPPSFVGGISPFLPGKQLEGDPDFDAEEYTNGQQGDTPTPEEP